MRAREAALRSGRMTRGYGQQERKRRTLTPLESELRPSGWQYERERETPLRRLRKRVRGRRPPPATLGAAIARGLLRMAFLVALGAGAAYLIARGLDRSLAVGFYLVGAGMLAVAFFSSAADMGTPDYALTSDRGEREYRVRGSLSYVLVGLALIAVGTALELTG